MRLPYRPRWLHRLYARLRGYFWLPCPLCGEMTGGHEWRDTLPLGGGRGRATCPRCPVEVVNGVGEGLVVLSLGEARYYEGGGGL